MPTRSTGTGISQPHNPENSEPNALDRLKQEVDRSLPTLSGNVENYNGKDYSALFDLITSAVTEEGKKKAMGGESNLKNKIQYEIWDTDSAQFDKDIQIIFDKFDSGKGSLRELYKELNKSGKKAEFIKLLQYKLLEKDKLMNQDRVALTEVADDAGGNWIRDGLTGLRQSARTIEREVGIPQGVTRAVGTVAGVMALWWGGKKLFKVLKGLMEGDSSKISKGLGGLGILAAVTAGGLLAFAPKKARAEGGGGGLLFNDASMSIMTNNTEKLIRGRLNAVIPPEMKADISSEWTNKGMESYAALTWATAEDTLEIFNMSSSDGRGMQNLLKGRVREQEKGLSKKDQVTMIENVNPLITHDLVRYVVASFAELPVPPRQNIAETGAEYIKRVYIEGADSVGTTITFPELLVTAAAIRVQAAQKRKILEVARKGPNKSEQGLNEFLKESGISSDELPNLESLTSKYGLTKDMIKDLLQYGSYITQDNEFAVTLPNPNKVDQQPLLQSMIISRDTSDRLNFKIKINENHSDILAVRGNSSYRSIDENIKKLAQQTEINFTIADAVISSSMKVAEGVAVGREAKNKDNAVGDPANAPTPAEESSSASPSSSPAATKTPSDSIGAPEVGKSEYKIPTNIKELNEWIDTGKILVVASGKNNSGLGNSGVFNTGGPVPGLSSVEIIGDLIQGKNNLPAEVRSHPHFANMESSPDRYWAKAKVTIKANTREGQNITKDYDAWISVWGGGSSNIKTVVTEVSPAPAVPPVPPVPASTAPDSLVSVTPVKQGDTMARSPETPTPKTNFAEWIRNPQKLPSISSVKKWFKKNFSGNKLSFSRAEQIRGNLSVYLRAPNLGLKDSELLLTINSTVDAGDKQAVTIAFVKNGKTGRGVLATASELNDPVKFKNSILEYIKN